MDRELSLEEFGSHFTSFQIDAFRLEALDVYRVPDEEPLFERFLAGERELPQANKGWVELVRGVVAGGRTISRVHVVTWPLSPYLCFETRYAYRFSEKAGERIRLIDRKKLPPDIVNLGDFWLFDSKIVVAMKYDSNGRFKGGWLIEEQSSVARHVRARDLVQNLSFPLANLEPGDVS